MKIWIVSSNRWHSAITEYALRSAEALSSLGHEVAFSPLKYSPAEARSVGVIPRVRPFSSFSIFRFKEFRRVFFELNPDLVICFGGPETTLLRFLPRASGVRFIRFRGEGFSQKEKNPASLKARLLRFSCAPLDGVLFPGEGLLREAKEMMPPHLRMRAFPIGVDVSLRRPMGERGPFSGPYVVLLGRLDPVKGHGFFLELFAKMIKTCTDLPKPKLIIIGEEANLTKAEIIAKIKKEKLEGHVVTLTQRLPREELLRILREATFGVIPSAGSEWIGRVTQEFLCLGTPVLVSDVGCLRELVFEGAGEVFPPGREESSLIQEMQNFYKSTLEESQKDRLKREVRALERYSLEAFQGHWASFLGDYFT